MPEPIETVLYADDRGVRITNTRAIVGNTTYSMANITSVSLGTIPPKRAGPILMIVFGALMAPIGFASEELVLITVVGLMLLAGGIWWIIAQKPTYAVVIGSASGMTSAITSKDRRYIQSIVTAMNEAFIKRG